MIEESSRFSFCMIIKWTVDCCLCKCMSELLETKSRLNSATSFITDHFFQCSFNQSGDYPWMVFSRWFVLTAALSMSVIHRRISELH